MGITIAVSFASALLIWLLPSLWARLPHLKLLDLFLLSIAMNFGAYTVIDLLIVESKQVDVLAVTTVFLIILCGTLVLWGIARHPPKLLRETSLAHLREDWKASPAWPVVALIGVALVYRWYTATFFDELSLYGDKFFEAEKELPYWFTSLGMIATIGIYPAGLSAWGKFRSSYGVLGVFWFTLFGVCSFIIFGMGRRLMFAFLIIIGWDLLATSIHRRKRWLALALLIFSIPLFIGISNVFQAYRLTSYRGVAIARLATQLEMKAILDSALEIDRTLSNLKVRAAMWRFNYEIANSHLRGRGEPQWGRLFLESIGNVVPKVFYPDKVTFSSEVETQLVFDLEGTDASENIFAATYADFGILSMAIAPLSILLFVWICAFALRRIKDPFLRTLLMGIALFYSLNMETSYLVPLGLTRDFIFIAMIYIAIRAIGRVAKITVSQSGRAQF